MFDIEMEEYRLKRRLFGEHQISFRLVPKSESTSSALKSSNRLIYIVKNKEDFLYVGEAKSSLHTRISRGFSSFRHYKRTGKKRGGYGGYKWIKLFDEEKTNPVLNELNITAVIFDERYAQSRSKLEAVEGELVYLIRQKTYNWPLYQNEIHFDNDFNKAAEIARTISESM